MSLDSDEKRTRTRSKGTKAPTELVGQDLSALSCPLARKRKLQEVETDQEQPTSKRKSHPLKLALDEGYNVDSDGSSEETEAKEDSASEESEEAPEEQQEEVTGEKEKSRETRNTAEPADEECLVVESASTGKLREGEWTPKATPAPGPQKEECSSYHEMVASSLLNLGQVTQGHGPAEATAIQRQIVIDTVMDCQEEAEREAVEDRAEDEEEVSSPL